MRLRAAVKHQTGKTKHSIGVLVGQEPTAVSRVPPAVLVEIVEVDGGVQLYRYSSEGVCVADTWHVTIAEAKAQAKFEFGIHDPDWSEAEDVE